MQLNNKFSFFIYQINNFLRYMHIIYAKDDECGKDLMLRK